jgi:hypothetical protein
VIEFRTATSARCRLHAQAVAVQIGRDRYDRYDRDRRRNDATVGIGPGVEPALAIVHRLAGVVFQLRLFGVEKAADRAGVLGIELARISERAWGAFCKRSAGSLPRVR